MLSQTEDIVRAASTLYHLCSCYDDSAPPPTVELTPKQALPFARACETLIGVYQPPHEGGEYMISGIRFIVKADTPAEQNPGYWYDCLMWKLLGGEPSLPTRKHIIMPSSLKAAILQEIEGRDYAFEDGKLLCTLLGEPVCIEFLDTLSKSE